MKFSAQEIAIASKGLLLQEGSPSSFQFDTRLLEEGQWFLALKGARDGHDFIPTALEKGCGGVLGQKVPEDWEKGFVKVDDTLIGFQNIARWARNNFKNPVIGITGSAGKTTTRALISAMLSEYGIVHQTSGNFNNHIGLPKTITDAPENADVWVLEMGMSAPKEIDLLQDIGKPTIRLISNIGAAHVEGCGSIEGVARAKGELFAGAHAGDICCVNMDDFRIAALPIPEHSKILTYGSTENCTIRLLSYSIEDWSTKVCIQTPAGTVRASIPVPGEFMAINACAAVAVGHAIGMKLDSIASGLAKYEPVGFRMKREKIGTLQFINDSYNANLLSMEAALQMLSKLSEINKLAILGDMLEMGEEEDAAHFKILTLALALKLPTAIVGSRFQKAALKLSEHQRKELVHCTKSSQEMADYLLKMSDPPNTILLKGSRGIRMEQIAEEWRKHVE